jgi:glyoxylase-like metal-dependent hydrolase (beta-lactamase superfamily II)
MLNDCFLVFVPWLEATWVAAPGHTDTSNILVWPEQSMLFAQLVL